MAIRISDPYKPGYERVGLDEIGKMQPDAGPGTVGTSIMSQAQAELINKRSIAASGEPARWWTPCSDSVARNWTKVAYGHGVFVAIGPTAVGADCAAWSVDGLTWTLIGGVIPRGTRLAFGGGIFLALGDTADGTFYFSTDGKTWYSQQNASFANVNWRSLAYGNGRFLTLGRVAGQTSLTYFRSFAAAPTTGTWSWSAVGHTFTGAADLSAWTDMAFDPYAGGFYVLSDFTGANTQKGGWIRYNAAVGGFNTWADHAPDQDSIHGTPWTSVDPALSRANSGIITFNASGMVYIVFDNGYWILSSYGGLVGIKAMVRQKDGVIAALRDNATASYSTGNEQTWYNARNGVGVVRGVAAGDDRYVAVGVGAWVSYF